ncbi:MAG: hypothetical protein IT462_13630 [Planctomycetes bacterium]|nr:hypothetical protein [Planctomycetota bacterium]
MRTGSKLALLVLILGAALVTPIRAQEGAPDFEVLFKDCDKILTLNFTADDVKSFNDNWATGADILKEDKEFLRLKKKNIKECFDYVIKQEAYTKWAKDKKLDGDAYLRKSLRIMFQHVKLSAVEMLKAQRGAITKELREKVGAMLKGELTADALKEYVAEWDGAAKILDNLENGVALIPAPTSAERTLLDDNKAAIQATMDKDKS